MGSYWNNSPDAVKDLDLPADERVVYVSLTDAGRNLREELKDIPWKMGGCVTLEQEDAANLYTLLYKLLDTMD